jgi:HAMP domain-containing protein
MADKANEEQRYSLDEFKEMAEKIVSEEQLSPMDRLRRAYAATDPDRVPEDDDDE